MCGPQNSSSKIPPNPVRHPISEVGKFRDDNITCVMNNDFATVTRAITLAKQRHILISSQTPTNYDVLVDIDVRRLRQHCRVHDVWTLAVTCGKRQRQDCNRKGKRSFQHES